MTCDVANNPGPIEPFCNYPLSCANLEQPDEHVAQDQQTNRPTVHVQLSALQGDPTTTNKLKQERPTADRCCLVYFRWQLTRNWAQLHGTTTPVFTELGSAAAGLEASKIDRHHRATKRCV